MSQFIQTSIDSGVATLRFNNPDKRNAISSLDQCIEMADALSAVNADTSVKVAILTGNGASFCAGGNIKDMKAKTGFMAGSPVEMAENYRNGIHRIPLAFDMLEVPVIAAVNGHAMGAGLDIACMCDMRIASEEAVFSEVFVRLGIISGIGGAWFLPRIIGQARAAELAFSGRILNAADALGWGLVSETVAPNALMPRAKEIALSMAQHSGVALRYYKRLLKMGARQDLRGALDATAALQALAHTTPEHDAAVDRMLESIAKQTTLS